MLRYQIKQPDELQPIEIRTILHYWEVDEWQQLSESEFKNKFAQSEFHLLTNENFKILAVARLNFDFSIKVQDQFYKLVELVGLVAMEKRRGYGKKLIENLVANVKARNLQTISFCEMVNRPFYQSCQLPMLLNQAKQLREPTGAEWLVPEDDDLLIVHLSEEHTQILKNLSPENLGYLVLGN
ncbi:hypothetical protein HUW51_02005 [Adhaeribacter swui]|uniref:GNAT family N-acetyltransferase n=1 Tax=Adhaeribacter swui TaxID=2086471 RepID=A0A7G7G323_9BACT|nr:hypothetical protein [Adhaeribacter swui]QNF31557.1 hypothetical protein HUW51_02005 [Adhaeribacter swui]